MIPLALALTAAEFDALNRSVASCVRDAVNPVFAVEAQKLLGISLEGSVG